MGYFLLIIFILVLTWPWWKRLLYNYISGRAEDTVRRMMGMPSRKEERRQRRNVGKENTTGKRAYSGRRNSQGFSAESGEHIIPPEYAVDVEYTEVREFRQTEIYGEKSRRGGKDKNDRAEWYESQVEDVEYVEIKTGK